MLAVDIAGSTDQDLQRIIADSCASHGTVVRVRVHVSRINSSGRPCAIVDMATAEQAKHVADAYAATCIGKSVVILLGAKPLAAHRPAPAPVVEEPPPKTMFQLLVKYENQLRSR